MHAVLQYDGACLRWASERLRGDRETIMVAVAQFGPAIQFALVEKIDLDFDVARTAVQGHGRVTGRPRRGGVLRLALGGATVGR